MNTVLGLFLLAMIVGLYMLPTILAADRKVPHIGSILVINVFLGWTLIGWVVALAMAARSKPTTGSAPAAPPSHGPS